MIKVLSAGLYTSIQDLGRAGYRDQGIPLCGSMDQHSTIRANQLCGNRSDAAVLECTVLGPTLYFSKSAEVALSGGEVMVMLNDKEVPMEQLLNIPRGSILRVGKIRSGFRCYLSIRGGVESPNLLGSMSQCPYLSQKSKIIKGDVLIIGECERISYPKITNKLDYRSGIIDVYQGPEFNQVSSILREELFTKLFQIKSNSNRMGYRLNGLSAGVSEIITSAVQPGIVQCTSSGDIIILMRDAQTTGGYSRVLQLTDSAINRLSQKRPLDSIKFNLVSE